MALLIQPFVRELVDGPTPLHRIEKPSPGTGASLLADVLTYPALGSPAHVMTEGCDEDEWRKRITASLRSGTPIVLLDNLRHTLDAAAVAAAITAQFWEDRLLGHSEMLRLPVRCAWIATGNNPALSHEITRRTIRIRLDAKQEHAWLRQGFRHPDLRKWAQAHRGDLVWAALTLGRAWLAAGRPNGRDVLGMFEGWARVIGGILGVTDIPGFLGNLAEFYERSDSEGDAWESFVATWLAKHQERAVGTAELFPVALATEPPLPLGDRGEQSQRTALGKLLSGARDRRFRVDLAADETVTVRLAAAGKLHGAQQWRLERVDTV